MPWAVQLGLWERDALYEPLADGVGDGVAETVGDGVRVSVAARVGTRRQALCSETGAEEMGSFVEYRTASQPGFILRPRGRFPPPTRPSAGSPPRGCPPPPKTRPPKGISQNFLSLRAET